MSTQPLRLYNDSKLMELVKNSNLKQYEWLVLFRECLHVWYKSAPGTEYVVEAYERRFSDHD